MKFLSIFSKFIFLYLFINIVSIAKEPVQPIAKLENEAQVINLCSKSSFYEDKTGKLRFEQIEKLNFKNFKGEQYNFHFSPSTFWIKFTIDSKLVNDFTYIIQVSNWYIDVADLYCRNEKGEIQILKEGDSEVFSRKTIKSKFPTFSLNIKANSTQTYFLKIENSQYNNFKIELVENLHYFKEFGDSREFIFGVILIRFLFYLSFLIFMSHDKTFRVYSIWGILLSFIYYFSGGYSSFVFQSSPYLANLAFFFTISFVPGVMSLYIYQIFDIGNRLPKVKWLFFGFACVGAINLPLNLFGHHAYISYRFIAFMAFFVSFQLLFSIWFYFKIHKPSIWYILPLIVYLPTFSAFYLRNAGVYELADFNFLPLTFLIDSLSIPFITGALLKVSKIETQKIEESYFKKKIETEKLQELDIFKTRFFTNISHEFRTPLTLILSPIQDLIKENPANPMYQIIHRNANRLLELINQLLDLSKLDAGQLKIDLEEIELTKYFRTLISSFTSLATSKKITFELHQNKTNIFGRIDEDKVEKIIINLLSNAFKFTNEGGKVSININYDDNIQIAIHDSGIGIPKAHLNNIFNRFYQIDDNKNRIYEGTGIGLALVKELVSVLNGTISVESKEGIGTSFFINLPIEGIKVIANDEALVIDGNMIEETEPKTLSTINLTTIPEPILAPNDNILLVVDDNDDIRAYVRSIFQNEYKIIEAVNGKDGLSKASETTPNLIISDLMMPEMDGFEFCKRLKSEEKTSHIPVVMLTAKANIESRIEGLELGADDYLLKPFNSNEIRVRVKNLIKKQESLREYFTGKTIDLKPNEVKVNSKEEVFLKKVKDIIEKRLVDSEFNVEQFSSEMGMSQSQLVRKLKALTNQTANEFIRDFRLQRAAELLRKKSGTVSEIAFQVGFENLSYFSKVFQEKFEKLPSEYQ